MLSRWTVGKGPEIDFNQQQQQQEEEKDEGEKLKRIQCDFNSRYRTSNGTCNNKNNPFTFGVAMIPFRR